MSVNRFAAALGVWVVLVVSLWISDSSPNVLVLGGIVALVAATVCALIDLTRAVLWVDWVRGSPWVAGAVDEDPRVNSLRHQMRASRWWGSTDVADTLVELIDDRLQVRHGLRRDTNPNEVAALLSPRLRRLVADPRRRTATLSEVQRILTEIEGL